MNRRSFLSKFVAALASVPAVMLLAPDSKASPGPVPTGNHMFQLSLCGEKGRPVNAHSVGCTLIDDDTDEVVVTGVVSNHATGKYRAFISAPDRTRSYHVTWKICETSGAKEFAVVEKFTGERSHAMGPGPWTEPVWRIL